MDSISSDRGEPSSAILVETFFSRLLTFLDPLTIVINRSEIVAYLANASRRAVHHQLAQAHRPTYQAATADILLTAAQLAQISSPVAQELLVDWITAAPELVIARLLPQP